MAAEPEIEFDRGVLGVEVELGSFEVTRERVDAYCAALGETNPLYFDERVALASRYEGLIAPPGLLYWMQLGEGPDPKVRFGSAVFASGDRVELLEPLRFGDTITVRQAVQDVYAKTGRTGTMVFVVRRSTFTNQHGRLVASIEQSTVHREV